MSRVLADLKARRSLFMRKKSKMFMVFFGLVLQNFWDEESGCIDSAKVLDYMNPNKNESLVQYIERTYGKPAAKWYIKTQEQAFSIKPNWKLSSLQ